MKNIVLVDDYKDFVKTVSEFIETTNNARCTGFTNPNEVVKYVIETTDNVDILITDYEMPQMNGLELAQKILMLNKGIRIIILSGYGKTELQNLCKKHGLSEKIEVRSNADTDFLKHLVD